MPNLDPEAVFTSMKQRVAEAVQSQFPFEGTKRRLELTGITFDEKSATPDDPHHVDNIEEQLKAKLSGMTWGVQMRGQLRLVDKATGRVLGEKTITLARLPRLTRRYSYIIDGDERQHDSVFRSKPRPYHRISAGGEVQAQWNLSGGRGFEIGYDPKKGRLQVKFGDVHIPLYSILHVLDVTDSAMEAAWGREVFTANVLLAKPERDVERIFSTLNLRVQGKTSTTSAEKAQRIRDYFGNETEVWPDAMKAALGKKYTNVNGEGLLASSKRLLAIQQGRTKEDPPLHEMPDDRQALSSKYLATTEDFLVEAVRKHERILRRQIADRIDKPEYGIDDILSANTYKKVIMAPFEGAQRPDQANPLQMLSGYMRTTIRGKEYGGVGGEQINLDADKEINPTHLGFLDPIQSPEGEDTGISLHLPLGISVTRAPTTPGMKSRVSSGQEIRTKVFDLKTGKMELVTAAEMEYAVVAYPDQVRWTNGTPHPVTDTVVCYDEERRTSKRPWKSVRYVLPSAKALLAFSANMVPFLQNNNGNRAMMAAKQQEQALALVHREAPLVQVKTDGAATFEQAIGTFVTHTAPIAGTVRKVGQGAIHIKTSTGIVKVPIYDHFPLNGGKGALHATPVVRVGQSVKKGELLADTNFSKGGQLAMGTNMRVAYIPWKGRNFEDGVIISESAAKKMASEHLHALDITIYPGMIGATQAAKARWVDSAVPDRATAERLAKLDDRGIIREGVVVHPGDVLVAALSPRQMKEEDKIAARIHKSLVQAYRDSALVWDHGYEGKVVRVTVTEALNRHRVQVHIATQEPMVIGDKVAGRHGNKGICSAILPDREMPYTKDGAIEMVLSPAGIPGRMNAGQMLETVASKVARKTGKPYVVENFVSGVDYTAKVLQDLKKHGLSDTEELFDPATGKPVGQVMVGDQFMLKLHHQVEKKMTARSFGTSYTHQGEAPKGAGIPGGGQKMDAYATYAMLAHGSNSNLREAFSFKSDGDQNAVWAAVITGRPLPVPQPTRGMTNFQQYLRALGVNVEKKGDQYTLMPLTDAHLIGDKERGIHGISNGAVRLPDKLVKARGVQTLEELGGLFDPKVTGGLTGKFWSHVELAERVPNPIFEPAIQVLTKMTKTQYNTLVSPTGHVGESGGFQTIVEKLQAIDVDKELKKERALVGSLSRSKLNACLKRIRYLEALKEHSISPVDAYTSKYLPVLPPNVRRVSVGLDGKQTVDDRNMLYLAIGMANASLKHMRPSTPYEDRQKARAHLYDAIKALRVTGAASEITAGRPRHYQGLMELLSGKTDGSGAPKESFFQEGVLSRRQDLSARSTIVPEPGLHLDEVGIPIPIAMEIYKPFVARELVREGKTPDMAEKWATQKQDHPQTLAALERAVGARPLMLKRDPVLHKFGIQAFKPRLVGGKAIQIHPLVCAGFNADFDGDQMGVFVPISNEAVDEAHRMLPSQNLFSPTHYGVMNVPSQDALLGIYQATKWGTEVKVADLTAARAVQMMLDGKLKSHDVVTVNGKKTTPGRLALVQALPVALQRDERLLHDPSYLFDKGTLTSFLARIGKEHAQAFPHVVDSWKDLGNKLAFMNGSSFSLHDFHDSVQFRDKVLAPFKAREAELHKTPMPKRRRDQEIVKLYEEARAELKKQGTARYNQLGDNRAWEWAQAGASKGWDQLSQLTMAPILVEDPSKRKVPVPITRSFGEGLSVSDYWTAMHGARKGTLDRARGTKEPGAVTKDIVNTMMGISITAEDCGATNGVRLSPTNVDVVDRFLARPVKLPDGREIEAGMLVTPAIVTELRNAHVGEIVVRSPMYCRMAKGICAKCFGHSERGRLHPVGTNIGVIAGQSLGEPVTQLTMRTFHSGGVSTGGVVDSFKRVKQLFTMPDALPNSATLSTVSGSVEHVMKDPRGGLTVVIAGKEHRVVSGQVLDSIRPGAQIRRGDTLSTGPTNPHELLKHTGSIDRVRNYLASEVEQAYSGMTRRRNIETVIRGMTNLTEVHEAPKESTYLRGELAPLSVVEAFNAEAEADGREKIKHAPKLRAMSQMPLSGTEDWLARLNYQRLKETFVEGAARGWSSAIHGHPIAGLAHGAEFGLRSPQPMMPPPIPKPGARRK